jgi:hypothetical protein
MSCRMWIIVQKRIKVLAEIRRHVLLVFGLSRNS